MVFSWPSLSFAILLVALSMSGYILWRRFQSRRRLIHRIAEMEALSDAGRAIVAAQLDVRALCELIAREAGKVIDNRTFQIGLFDGSFYQIQFWTINGQLQPAPQSFNLREDLVFQALLKTTHNGQDHDQHHHANRNPTNRNHGDQRNKGLPTPRSKIA
jgi:hypothetical protein